MRDEANKIIVKLIQSDEFNHCMRKVKPELKEDLKAELALILLETDPQKIVTLNDSKELTFYTVRIILTLAFSKTSPFYKKYRIAHNEFVDTGAIEDHSIINRKITEERALNEIEKIEWYESEMVKLYLECGNYREMQRLTRIPYVSCFCTVRKAIKKLQQVI